MSFLTVCLNIFHLQSVQELSEESANRIRVFSDISEDTEEISGAIDYDLYDRNVFRTTARRSVYKSLPNNCLYILSHPYPCLVQGLAK